MTDALKKILGQFNPGQQETPIDKDTTLTQNVLNTLQPNLVLHVRLPSLQELEEEQLIKLYNSFINEVETLMEELKHHIDVLKNGGIDEHCLEVMLQEMKRKRHNLNDDVLVFILNVNNYKIEVMLHEGYSNEDSKSMHVYRKQKFNLVASQEHIKKYHFF